MGSPAYALQRDDAMFARMYRVDAWCEQKQKCGFCHAPLSRDDATTDHLKPRCRGGTTTRKNIKAACRRCNRAKGNMSQNMFLKAIKHPLASDPIAIWWCHARRRIWLRTERAERRIKRMVGLDG